jgi:hypothetical protein
MNHINTVLSCFVLCHDVFMYSLTKFFDRDRQICLCFVLMMCKNVRSDLYDCA